MKCAALVAVLLQLVIAKPGYAEEPCKQLSSLDKKDGVTTQVLQWLAGSTQPQETPCGSLMDVMRKLTSGSKSGGRRLEAEQPLNVPEAEANMKQAMGDPEVRSRMERVDTATNTDSLRLLYKAAILDDAGYYGARDLLIQKLQQQLQ